LLVPVHGDCHTTINREVHKMTRDRISEYINELINTTKDQWIWFVDDQIDVLQGKRNHFHGNAQKAYVIDNEDAEKRLADWQERQRQNIRNKD
jgi:uncharacterized protein YjbJ (UPF0337 family)